MLRLIAFLLAAILSLGARSQTVWLRGVVTDRRGAAVDMATVTVSADAGGTALGCVSDTSGRFSVAVAPRRTYTVRVTRLCYAGRTLSVEVGSGDAHVSVVLDTAAVALGEVSVTARRGLVRREADRIVLDAARLAATATSAMDVLRHAPGVVVEDGVISMPGKGAVMVLLDGREMKQDSNGLAAVLGALPAADLRQIEIMTTPPARYSAEGQAGIVNLVTRRLRTDYLGGSAAGKLRAGERTAGSTSLSMKYRGGRLSAYATTAAGLGTVLTRSTCRVNYPQEIWETKSRRLKSDNYVHATAGVDCEVWRKSSAGLLVSYSGMRPDADTRAATAVSPGGGEFESFTDFDCAYRRLNANLHYAALDVCGGRLSADADYLSYTISDRVDFRTTHADGLCYLNRPRTGIDAAQLKADMELPRGRVTMACGASLNHTRTSARTDYERASGLPRDLSDHFVYIEDILAAYADAKCSLSERWEAKAGVRAEWGRLDGQSPREGSHTVKRQLDIFPTAYVGYRWREGSSLSLSLSGRIKRPVYVDINPFTTYTDARSVKTGNPGLLPEKSRVCEVGVTLGGAFSLSGSVTWRDRVIAPLTTADEARRLTVETVDNIMRKRMYSLDASYATDALGWLSSTVECSVYTIAARPLPGVGLDGTTHTSLFAYTSNNVFLNRRRTLVANVWGQYQGSERDVAGESAARYRVDIGVKWTLASGRLSLALECRNMLASRPLTVSRSAASSVTRRSPAPRIIVASLTVRFGKKTGVRQRSPALGAERL